MEGLMEKGNLENAFLYNGSEKSGTFSKRNKIITLTIKFMFYLQNFDVIIKNKIMFKFI
jgi:hypothetical protein